MADRMRNERPSVRDLARQGNLCAYFEQATKDERRRLWIEAYELLYPVVFIMIRQIESRRGHRDCMVSVSNLRPDCLDRFHNDMDAVLDDLFSHASVPIQNLEGWVRARLVGATVDSYRRRRGERGALQRPRIPKWLARELNHDEMLMGLAIEMLEWVGVESTAGNQDWPIDAWSAKRAALGCDSETAERSVAQDVLTVIAAMRKRPKWYADYVERPMGHKRPPLAGAWRVGAEPVWDPRQSSEEEHTADESRRSELAALAVAAIAAKIERGEDVTTAVVYVISTVFGSGTACEYLDRMPGRDAADDEVVIAHLADAETVDRIVAVVLDLLSR